MLCHEFGDSSKLIIILLPGTMCYWHTNFAKVIPSLIEDFCRCCLHGFDMKDRLRHVILAEVEKTGSTYQAFLSGKSVSYLFLTW